jgi:hypothetical protein
MSKVARSARVGSRNRMEAISADKTITSAETGETYLIDWNTASALTITLPAMQDGAYFKFIFKSLLAVNGTVVINSADNTAGDFAGSIFEQVTGGADAATAVQLCGSHDILTINDDVDIGSWLEVYCDGSKWYWTGMLSVSAVGLAVFST